jgi:rubrerythrin
VALELAEIFRSCGPAYRAKYAGRIPSNHRQAMRAIEACRTEALGGQVFVCSDCGEVQYSYHSCRNRHCPKCQAENGQVWLEQQAEMLLPVPYFLLTFTLPAGLRELTRSHPRAIYALLFRLSAEATQQLAQDPRFMGGQAGLVGVLHTWGRNLAYHPHGHYRVPAGGLAADGHTWLAASQAFLLPVRALSKIFRAKMRQAVRKVGPDWDIPPAVWQQKWVVHCKAVGGGRQALQYLAPYIFRVAIGNKRIETFENDQVTFRYKASDTGLEQRCTLSAEAFIHRFLQHVLPKGFVKVRYYGFFSSGMRERLTAIQVQLGSAREAVAKSDQTQAGIPAAKPVHACPVCGHSMQPGRMIAPTAGPAPP